MARQARKRRPAAAAPTKPVPEAPLPRPAAVALAPATADEPQPALEEVDARRADLLWAAGLTGAFLLVFVLLNISQSAAVSVLLSFSLAYALDPLIDWAEAKGLSRTTAIALLFLAVALAIAGFLFYLVPAIGAEVAKLPEFLRNIGQKALPRVEDLIGQRLPDNIRDAAAKLGREGGGVAEKALPSVASVLLNAIGGTASVLLTTLGLLVIPVLTFYLLRDYDVLVAWARGLIPRRYEQLVASRFAEVDSVLSSFIRGQITVGAILTVLYAIGLSSARLELAVVIAAVAGFGNMIPYVGPALGACLALVSLAISWQGPWQLAVVGGTFALAMAAEPLVITPRIVGEKVGLSALAVLIAVLVFGELFGFVGILLAVPVTAALKVVGRVVLYRYRRSRIYGGTR